MNISGNISKTRLVEKFRSESPPNHCNEFWPVEGDGEKMEYRGGAAEDVTGGPHVTEERTKDPGPADLKQRAEIYNNI